MRSLTLPWSGLKAHSLPSSASCPKASKSCGSNLFPFNSLCKNQTSTSKKLSLRNPYLNFSRDPGASCESRNDVDCKNCKMTRESVHNLANDSGLIKFVMFFGLLTLQGSQTAVAAVDFASGLQSFPFLGDLGDISRGFASALLAARNSAATVFAGTFGALAAMTVISVILGRTFHYVDEILPFRFGQTDLPIDDIAAVCLLVYFGVSTLLDAASTDGLKSEDEQKEAELAVSEFSGNGAGIIAAASIIISTFTLVFVAEWGDKSFFSTIALAAASSPLGVIGGALAGHVVATLMVNKDMESDNMVEKMMKVENRKWPPSNREVDDDLKDERPPNMACCVGRLFTRDILIREGIFKLQPQPLAKSSLHDIFVNDFRHKLILQSLACSQAIAYIGGVLFLFFAAVTVIEIVS
ncbi:hypothetical protein CUMW_042660 [Citrus unshiu]|nr:hypothetical protein CUMW_042660 [Citrus unshiu]